MSFRIASTASGGTFHVEADGVNVTGSVTLPNTGGWQAWTTITKTITLSTGTQVLRLVVDGAGSNGTVANFNWIAVQ